MNDYISTDLRLFAFICGKKGIPIPHHSRVTSIALILVLCTFAGVRPTWAQAEPTDPAATESPATLERRSERGPVTARVILEPAEPRIGDPLTLRLEVTAEAGVELLMPEFGQSLDRFAIRDFVPRDSIDGDGRTLATQRYVLSAPMSGPQYIPTLAIEFVDRRAGMRPAPEGEDTYEILTERLDFQVRSVLPEEVADQALEPPLGELAPLGASDTAKGWVWLLLLPVVLVAAWGGRWWLGARTKARRASAHERASARLKALMARPRPEGAAAVDAFFVELSDLVRHYLEDRFGLQAPEFTTEEFLDVAAGSPDLNQAHQGFLRDFLRRADQVKFARYLPDADYIEEILDAAGRFLEQTRAAGEPEERAMPRTWDLPFLPQMNANKHK
ncbi:hypothetical protein [Candidatus Thiosymbion oneisti]|uniref:hypothetical protein n=1 Tax=Candidatus Thiosymbion oneisti TaxID=589554 RepID=UPI000B8000E8|nr:hypothetical protein [Candidatus Thiosymbion oneisti]